jgi:hypothetical protein
MTTEKLKPAKTYLHLCFECEKELENEQKIDNCPDCNKPFKEVWEHFVYHSGSAYTYRHQCENCKIMVDDGNQENRLCPQCEKPLEGSVLSISYMMSNNFWEKIKKKIRECLLP